jgi:DNA-binding beta-propeller fold protein YncE
VKGTVSKTIPVGSKPNGVAWDDDHGVLLVCRTSTPDSLTLRGGRS